MEEIVQEYIGLMDDIKFLMNSEVRISILTCLSTNEATIKEIHEKTELNYTSISSNLKKLLDYGAIVKRKDKYALTSQMRIKLINMLYLNNNINYLNDLSGFFNSHMVDNDSFLLKHLPYMNEYKHETADIINPYKVTDIIEVGMMRETTVRCICIYLHPGCDMMIKRIMEQRSDFQVIVPTYLADHIIEHANNYKTDKSLKNVDFLVKTLNDMTLNLALVITTREVILGLVQQVGELDKNHCIVSHDKRAIKWALDLYKQYETRKASTISIRNLVCKNNNLPII